MKKITLDDVIKKERARDAEFNEHYQNELLINAISKMIVELRQRAHLTQIELANRALTTQPVIARLESGTDTRVPSLRLLIRIAAAANAKLNICLEFYKQN